MPENSFELVYLTKDTALVCYLPSDTIDIWLTTEQRVRCIAFDEAQQAARDTFLRGLYNEITGP